MRPIATSVFPVRRTALFGSTLLVALVATALLSAGAARAALLNTPVECEALTSERLCISVPTDEGVLDTMFIMSDTGGDGDPLFWMVATATDIILFFTEFATGNAMDGTGFGLTGLVSMPDLVVAEKLDVRYVGDWGIDNQDIPDVGPFVTLGGNIQWTSLAGGDPSGAAAAVISLNFVPEPGTVVLMGLGLAGLGSVGRSRREETKATT